MATKPTSASFTWSTDTNFSSGDASGNPTKVAPAGWPANLQGFVPGLKYVAEFRNWLWNIMGQWTGWLESGSSAGAADAHIVETNASGDTNVRSLGVLVDLAVTRDASVGRNAVLGGALSLDGVISPPTMGTTEDNLAPTGIDNATVLRLTGHASGTDLRGIEPNVAGGGAAALTPRLMFVLNIGGTNITLNNQASADAYARFAFANPVVLTPLTGIALIYDPISERWRKFGVAL